MITELLLYAAARGCAPACGGTQEPHDLDCRRAHALRLVRVER